MDSPDIPYFALGSAGYDGGAVDDLLKCIFLYGFLLDLFFHFLAPCLGCGREGVGEEVENDGQPRTANQERLSESDGAHSSGQQGDRFPMPGEVGQDVESRKEDGHGKDGLS